MTHRPVRLLLSSPVALALLFVVGCGSSSNGTGAAGAGGGRAGAGGGVAGADGGGAGAGGATAGADGGGAGAGGGGAGAGGVDGGAAGASAGADGGAAGADGGAATAGHDGGTDAGDAAAADVGTDVPTACNTIVNAATAIAEMNVAAAFPAGAAVGGALAEGTYYRTGADFYTGVAGATGPNGKMRQETLLVTALGNATMFIVEDIDNKNGAGNQRSTQTMTLSGTTVAVAVVCPPSAGGASFSYTSASGKLTIYNPLNSPPEVATFTKAP